MTSAFPSQEEALALHQRLLEGDPVAPSDVAVAYLEPLARALGNSGDDHDCQTAAEDALLSYIKAPGTYHPDRAPLETYLKMAARSDLKNLQAKAHRHTKRAARLEDVELSAEHRNSLHDRSSNPEDLAVLAETVREHAARRAVSRTVVDGLTERERAVLELMRAGERRTECYAQALGITSYPLTEQRTEVKRVKDRLKVRIKRSGGTRG